MGFSILDGLKMKEYKKINYAQLTDKELQVVKDFNIKFVESQKPLDKDIAEIINRKFWDLL